MRARTREPVVSARGISSLQEFTASALISIKMAPDYPQDSASVRSCYGIGEVRKPTCAGCESVAPRSKRQMKRHESPARQSALKNVICVRVARARARRRVQAAPDHVSAGTQAIARSAATASSSVSQPTASRIATLRHRLEAGAAHRTQPRRHLAGHPHRDHLCWFARCVTGRSRTACRHRFAAVTR